jgi:predicted dehydrogenase
MASGGKARSGENEPRRNDKVRFAVVGQGYFAQAAILPAFDKAKRCELTALFSDDPAKLKKLKKAYDVEHALTYDQYDEFLGSGAVDAVYIALPNDMHCDYTVRAAKAGVHVLCEKPMAVTSEECQRMITACDEARVKLMIAYRLHFEEANMSAVDLIERGKLGDPRYFSSTFSMQVKPGNIRTKDERGGGPLFDVGVYCINAARYLFRDEPIEVMAMSATKAGDPRFREVEEQVSAVLRFPNERLAAFTCSFGAADASAYDVVGTKGRLRLDPAYEFAGALQQEITVGDKTKTRKFKKRDQVSPELIYFADCIRNDETPEPSGHEGMADVRVIEAIKRSAESGARSGVEAVSRSQRPSLQQERKKPAHGMPQLVGADTPSD